MVKNQTIGTFVEFFLFNILEKLEKANGHVYIPFV